VPTLDLRFRVPSAGLLTLPWTERLADWDITAVPLRDIPVGPSRHLVRFVETDGRLWALKDLPRRVAQREYEVLRALEDRSLSAVRAAGIVCQPFEDAAVLVTRYLDRSWQYRRLLLRVPATATAHRSRLFDAMAALMVDLHRNGFYWGDCSLANTLFMRDGQVIRAWMVDGETAESHTRLSEGQRQLDLEIMVENVAGGLLDVAARREEPPAAMARVLDEATGVADRYEALWRLLHDEPVVGLGDQLPIEARLRRLNDLGFAVDEVRLESTGTGDDALRLRVAVAGRTFHSEQLRSLTGLEVGEGQATILLNDLRSHQGRLQREAGHDVDEREAARSWLTEVFTPGVERAGAAVRGHGDPIQAYCDLLEVRWLLSEQAGADVGDGPALAALAEREAPADSAAGLAFVDMATSEMPAIVVDFPEPDTAPIDLRRDDR
jgi:hypothetical protein